MSSRAAKLGIGASFQQAQPVSARRAAIDAASAAPTEGAPPPTELPLTAISLNPDNPRTELGDLTDLSNSLRDHGQKTAISIMSRFAYLEGSPGREQDLEPGTRYVVIDGNSRLAAAREAGLEAIKVMVDDGLGGDPDEVLESALVANIHRKDLDHLDEARALQQLLKIHGTQEALAARLHRSQPWVSSRLALLKLTPQLQKRLEDGTEPADLLRSVGNKKQEEQEAHLAKLKRQRAEEAEARKRRAQERKAAREASSDIVKNSGGNADSAGPKGAEVVRRAGQPVPEPRPGGDLAARKSEGFPLVSGIQQNSVVSPSVRLAGAEPATVATAAVVPWNDGAAAMDVAFSQLDDQQRSTFILRYFEKSGGVQPLVEDLRGRLTPEARIQLSGILQEVAALLAKVD
ncbi:ParB/RepB/Spo0J family partition protein [Streptomyces sp. NPDC050848]|uniref:ParB/RepB/Spo0J family partition protein n=1 Tax=Streptomyces sp. NPDC050848 TaxID=3155791 RepID=UPI0033C4D0E5